VRKVEIRGLRELDDDKILKILKTRGERRLLFWKRSDVYRADFLRTDEQLIVTYAAQQGFLDASAGGQAVQDTAGAWVDVYFDVVEGPRSVVRTLDLTKTSVVAESKLRQKMTTKVGEPFNPQGLATDRRAILDLYAEQAHYPRIETKFERTDSTQVDVDIAIEEGPMFRVGTLEIVGLHNVDTSAARREVLLRPGGPFRSGEVSRSAERIYETRLFQYASFEAARYDTQNAVVDVRLRLREAKHRWVEGGVGVSSTDGARVLGEWGHGNVGGKGREVAFTGRTSFGQRREFYLGARYVEPWFLGYRVRGRAAVFGEQREEFFREASYDQRDWGLDFTLSRKLNRFTEASLGFRPYWVDARTTPDLPPEDLVGFQSEPFFTTRFTGSLSYDERDNVFDPFRGQYHLASGEYSGQLLGGEGRFLKGILTSHLYRPVSARTSLALRVQVGGINPLGPDDVDPLETVPLNDLLRTGGSTRVRGYGEDEITGADGDGGLMLLNTNVELRFPVWRIFSGAAFLDGGNVWAHPKDFKLRDLGFGDSPIGPNQFRWTTGGGLRLKTPVGPFRFDLAYRLQDVLRFQGDIKKKGLEFILSIGQAY
jgi:outer membrane protein insertion porin family